ncbi:Uncharacterised protein [Raoultella terrigena]|uniref:Uncharacterized protein n=1 Tax=Raoultella terrigena TaxID=577 RepID=A0A4V6J170_RAOTE|nr:Uncharacterised protein [Raoultella terrigena]
MGITGPKWLRFLAQNPGYSPGKIEHHADSTRLILTLYEMFMETVWRQIMSGFFLDYCVYAGLSCQEYSC